MTSTARRTHRRFQRPLALAGSVLLTAGLLALIPTAAEAERWGTMTYTAGGNGTYTQTLTQTNAANVTATYSFSGSTFASDGGNAASNGIVAFPAKSATSAMFSPNLPSGTQLAGIETNAGGCATTSSTTARVTCADRGTMTVTFSRPVTNPRVHVMGLGGSQGTTGVPGSYRIFAASGTLTSVPAGASMAVVGSATNLSVVGSKFQTTGPRPSTACVGTGTVGATSTSGCGTLQITGSDITSLTFAIAIEVSGGTGTNSSDAADHYNLVVSLPDQPLPVANPDTFLAMQLDTATIDALANDTQATGYAIDPTLTVFTATSGWTLSNGGKTATSATYGVYTIQSDGTVVFDPVDSYSGAVPAINYQITDSAGSTASSTISGTVTAATSNLTIVKSASGTPTQAGQTISYSFTVTNTGNTTVTNVGVSDNLVTGETCTPTTLAPSASATCTANAYTVTQADVDAGSVVNTATATGTPQSGAPAVSSNVGTTTTSIARTTQLKIIKSASGAPTAAGQPITYSFTVENTGNTTVTGVGVSDNLVTGEACTPTTLAPGAIANCTANDYSVTQADMDAGSVTNTAAPTGTGPSGAATVTVDPTSVTQTTTPLTPSGALVVSKTKTSAGNPTGAGDVITYSITALNTGNVTLTNVTVSDPLLSGSPLVCSPTTLAPGAEATCTVPSYTVTQADADAGTVVNEATGGAQTPDGSDVPPATSTVVTPVDSTRTITVGLAQSANTITEAGQVITYTYTVTNSGTTTLVNPTVTDTWGNVVTCTPTTLAPGDSATCSNTHTVTQADVDAGEVTNTATGTATPPSGADVTGTSNTVTKPIERNNQLKITKSASGSPSVAGDTITYSFEVENTGNTTITDVGVADDLVTGEVCSPTTLAPGATATCTADDYVVTQADVDAGEVVNTAAPTGSGPSGTPEPSVDPGSVPSTTTPIDQVSSLKITKSASGAPAVAGDTITYTFEVENTGNVTITGVGVDDPLVTGEVCSPTTLAPGETATCTADDYVVTQADVDAGTVVNTAAPTGTPPTGAPPVTTDPESDPTTTTPIDQVSSLKITKSASGAPAAAGDTITYTFEVENTGNVTITGVGVADDLVTGEVCSPTTLEPGETATCTADDYVVTQADVDAGTVVNTAAPTGTPPAGAPPVTMDPESDPTTTTPIDQVSSLKITKSASGSPSVAGDTITYTFEVENTGNVTITGVGVADDLVTGEVCSPTTLEPGETATCTADDYVVTQADVDAGTVVNTAAPTGTPPTGAPPVTMDPESDPTTTTPIDQVSSLKITKSASGSPSVAGDTITYTFEVENTGNVTITDVGVDDPLVTGEACSPTTLAPGETATCTADDYVVTQADVDAGEVVNTAAPTGTPPTGAPPVTMDPESDPTTTTPIDQVSSLKITKSASGAPAAAGDTITYSFEVENTGNVTITDVGVADPLVTGEVCSPTTLEPGETATCTADDYVVTQADVDAGTVVNTAAPTGTPPTGAPPVTTDPESDPTTTTPIAADSSIETTLVASGSPTSAGDEITYTATVENTGNTTITDLVVTDELGNTYVCDVTELAPGESATCTATYPVTQADVDAGQVVNTATGVGTDPVNAPVSDQSLQVVTPIDQVSSLKITKSASGAPAAAGDTITYSFEVENTGNVTITDVGVADPLVTGEVCSPTTLAPGETATCTADDYVVTQADVDAGTVVNTAAPTGTPPTGAPPVTTDPESEPSTTTLIVPVVELAATLVQDSGTVSAAGDEITYTYTVENTGNVTVGSLTLVDDLGNSIECDVSELAPGEVATCTATYPVTQADVDAGQVVDQFVVSGESPSGTEVSATSNEVVKTIIAAPELTTTLVGSGSPTSAGDEITYTATVENTGNTTITDLVVTDELGNTYACDVTELAPGESATCTATYPVTQADVDAGTVVNTATGEGNDPSDAPVVDESNEVETLIEQTPSLAATLVQDSGTVSAAGDEITYTYTVENTGNVTVGSLTLVDDLGNSIECDVSELAPGEVATCTATYPVTQADVDAGQVVDQFVVSGESPSGTEVSATSNEVVKEIIAAPGLAITDAAAGPLVDANGDGRDSVGDTIVYTFTVENTGNVTLTDVQVTDQLGNTIVCSPSTLAPGETATCVSEPTPITQDQLDEREVVNVGVATATPPAGGTVESDPSEELVTPLNPVPGVAIETRIDDVDGQPFEDVNGDGKLNAGDLIWYSFVITNNGSATIENVQAIDQRLEEQGISVTCGSPMAAGLGITPLAWSDAGPLEPGQSIVCVASSGYTVTADDVQERLIENSATVTADVVGSDDAVSATSNTVQSIPQATPRLELETTYVVTDTNGNGVTDAGDEVRFTFVVTNTGDIRLEDIQVIDERLAAAGITITCTPTALAPGESATCTTSGPYEVTAEDVANGEIVSNAVATGVDRQTGDVVEVESNVTETVIPTGVLAEDEESEEAADEAEDLPDTGGPSVVLTAIGAGSAVAGVLLVARRRRRDDAA